LTAEKWKRPPRPKTSRITRPNPMKTDRRMRQHPSQPDLPPILPLDLSHQPAKNAFALASASSLHLAFVADQVWSHTFPGQRFGQTYHTASPSQWCLQSLSLNISHDGLAQYKGYSPPCSSSLARALLARPPPSLSGTAAILRSTYVGALPLPHARQPPPFLAPSAPRPRTP